MLSNLSASLEKMMKPIMEDAEMARGNGPALISSRKLSKEVTKEVGGVTTRLSRKVETKHVIKLARRPH